jgi:type I restriction enzyme M protein
LAGLEKTHKLLKVQDLIAEGVLSLATGDEVGKLAYGTGAIPFIRTSDISNWEMKSDPKHGVSREIYESLAKKQDVQAGDVLMVKDGTYLIGTCAIVTEADKEILYQSHLYKIRVNKNGYGLNPYLLLAILSSSAVQKQIRSKQFTQDIIDSLGERINELVLPVPVESVIRDLVTEQVRQSVFRRGEAKELARKARDSVCG